jgi:protein-L-isoaspartate(D-aspartate) O-methyltransferase
VLLEVRLVIDIALESMIQSLLVNRGIDSQPVIEAFRQVPRAVFTPEYLQRHMYEDDALPIGLGQRLTSPALVARMLQELNLPKRASVLEIGTGTGYQSALLAKMASTVYTIETLPELAARARKVLVDNLGVSNVRFKVDDGHHGWSEQAPFDGIIVNAAVLEIPYTLVGQLRDGARLVAPVGESAQRLHVVHRQGFDEETVVLDEDVFLSDFMLLSGGASDD